MNTLTQENQTLIINTINAANGQDVATVINLVKGIAASAGIEEGLAIAFADEYIKQQMSTPAPDTSIKNLQDFITDPSVADAAAKASTEKKMAAAQQQAVPNAAKAPSLSIKIEYIDLSFQNPRVLFALWQKSVQKRIYKYAFI